MSTFASARGARSFGPSGSSRFVVFLFPFLLPVFSERIASAAVVLTEASGVVQAHNGSGPWAAVSQGYVLSPGDEIKTDAGSRALLTFDDGSKVEIGPKGEFTLEEAAAEKSSMRLGFGLLKAWVTKALSRRFTVRTPTAVCSVRGTEFGVEVQRDGATSVQLFKGLLAIGDKNGNEVLLKDGQKVQVDSRGLGAVSSIKGSETRKATPAQLREALKREMNLNATKEEVQMAAALEQKSAVYKNGKALIDVNGNRVRLDDYIIRGPNPAVNLTANQFKLVVLNERVSSFNYFYYLGTFNKPLPGDISGPLRQIQGQPFSAPEFFLTAFQTGRSNTTDSVAESAIGGHLVDVNNNKVSGDAQTSVYNPATNSVVQLKVPTPGGTGNDPFYTTVFDHYSLAFNGVNHITKDINLGGAGVSGGVLAAYAPTLDAQGNSVFNAANKTGAQSNNDLNINLVTRLLSPPNCSDINNCTGLPDGNMHMITYSESPDGSKWDRFENYIIDDNGKVASQSTFASLTAGASFLSLLQSYNYEQIITASEFNGRKIDLVFEPKVLIESGLIH